MQEGTVNSSLNGDNCLLPLSLCEHESLSNQHLRIKGLPVLIQQASAFPKSVRSGRLESGVQAWYCRMEMSPDSYLLLNLPSVSTLVDGYTRLLSGDAKCQGSCLPS
jgi:hypothetical protein